MNLREKLGQVVSLKVPSGAIWEVGLEFERDSLYFKLGWKQFIKDNALKENDQVIFKYNGSSVFDVLFFDGKSLCEKEDSYFIRKCDHPDLDRENQMREQDTAEKTSGEVPQRRQPEQDKDVEQQVDESFKPDSASEDDNVLERTPSTKSTKDDAQTRNFVRRSSTTNRKISRMKRSKAPRTPREYISNRRPVSDEEKAKAEQRANAETSIESLVIVIKEYHVYKRFSLTLPSWWSNDHLPKKDVLIKLQVEEKIWIVKFDKRCTGGVLTAGWKKFALDNALEEHDVCLFNIVNNTSIPIIMDVKIFRVVDEVVAPTPLSPPSSSHRGRGTGRMLF